MAKLYKKGLYLEYFTVEYNIVIFLFKEGLEN